MSHDRRSYPRQDYWLMHFKVVLQGNFRELLINHGRISGNFVNLKMDLHINLCTIKLNFHQYIYIKTNIS